MCMELGFAVRYISATRFSYNTYTSKGSVFVNNVSQETIEDKFVSPNDLEAASKLVDTLVVVIKSNNVMNKVAGALQEKYPGVTAYDISSSVSMAQIRETGVITIEATTEDPQLSADIVNAIVDYATGDAVLTVGVGNITVVDHAQAAIFPNDRGVMSQGLTGAAAGMLLSAVLLAVLYLLDRRVMEVSDITDNYTPPVLAFVKPISARKKKSGLLLDSGRSSIEVIEAYSELRMNLFHIMRAGNKKSVVITSSVLGEGKSVIAANLAISCAMSGKSVLLVDCDLRQTNQKDIFEMESNMPGFSEILMQEVSAEEAICHNIRYDLDVLPSGRLSVNPSDLLQSEAMTRLLEKLEREYDMIILDMPPINTVADPLILSDDIAGCLIVVKQGFSDHREIRRALVSSEIAGMDVLGFVFYGDIVREGTLLHRILNQKFYKDHDFRKQIINTVRQEEKTEELPESSPLKEALPEKTQTVESLPEKTVTEEVLSEKTLPEKEKDPWDILT